MPDSVGKRKRRDVTARKHAAREERRVARASRKKDREAGLIEPGPPIGPAEQSEFLVVEPEADAAGAQSSEDKPSPKPEARPRSEDGKRPGEQTEESAEERAGESAKESGGPGASAGSSSRSERT